MKGLPTLVGEGISVPDTVFPDPKNVKDALQTTLEEVNGTLICLVFFFNLFSVLLSPLIFQQGRKDAAKSMIRAHQAKNHCAE